MLLLGIETSGRAGSVALSDDGTLVAERSLDPDSRHARMLIPEIQAALAVAGRAVTDCELIGVSIGPGSFTGLRVGVVCAKMLAYSLGAKLVGVETLSCIAAAAPPEIARLQVVMDAQRQELFVAQFQRDSAEWKQVGDVEIQPSERWIAGLTADDVVTGPGLEKIAAAVEPRCRMLPEHFWQPKARQVCALAIQKFSRGEEISPHQLEPWYLRKSAAEEKWDARQANT